MTAGQLIRSDEITTNTTNSTHKNRRKASGHGTLFHTEEMLWANQQLYPEAGTFHIPLCFAVEGQIDPELFQRSVDVVISRHNIFRTTFRTQSGCAERRVQGQMPVKVEWIPFTDGSNPLDTLRNRCQRPFDLETGPLWRISMIEGADKTQTLLIVIHHIIFDEASIEPFAHELFKTYDALTRGRELDQISPIQFVDYVAIKNRITTPEDSERNRVYWNKYLKGMERLIELPFYRCPNDERRFRGGRFRVPIASSVANAIDAYCRDNEYPVAQVMLAAFNALLYRYFGATDITVISPADDRAEVGCQGVLGFAGNLLPMRVLIKPGMTFTSLVDTVLRMGVDNWIHRDIPFNELVQVIRGEEAHVTEAPFTVMFESKEWPVSVVEAGGIRFVAKPVDNGLAKMPLSLTVFGKGANAELEWEFNKHVFDEWTINEIAAQYGLLIAELCERPNAVLEQFQLRTSPRRILGNRPVYTANEFRLFPRSEIEQSIVERFRKQVDRIPYKIALNTGTTHYSYAELDAAACKLANRLSRDYGIGERLFALCFEHDASFIVGALGTLMACNAYTPIDIGFPETRIVQLLSDANVTAIICNNESEERARALGEKLSLPLVNLSDVLDADIGTERLPSVPAPDSVAYVLFTSGSAGRPKGVMQTHRNVLHHIRSWTNSLRITEYDHHTAFSAFSWDSAVQDIYGALLNGATLFPRNLRDTDISELSGWLLENAISVVHTTVPFYRRFVKSLGENEIISGIRAIAIGGEAVNRGDLDQFKAHFTRQCSLVNMYGATESSSALFFVADHDSMIDGEVIPLGFPPEDTEVVLVRNGVEQRAHSIVGEIGIKSEFVAKGYWQSPEQTRERFSETNDGTGRRMYMTGDLGRVLHDGSIEYVGRKDFQVKIRGFRIGLGEIESFVAEHPAIKDVVVIATHDLGDEVELVAYYVAYKGVDAPTPQEMREYLLARIPDYMVPRFLISLESLPLTARGKIDREALPKPALIESRSTVQSRDYVEPRDEIERDLVKIWEEVLSISPVGIRDNFFALGGHSMLGFEMFDKVKTKVGIKIPPVTLYRGAATVELLASKIKAMQCESSGAAR